VIGILLDTNQAQTAIRNNDIITVILTIEIDALIFSLVDGIISHYWYYRIAFIFFDLFVYI
jgi:hypothetical protein